MSDPIGIVLGVLGVVIVIGSVLAIVRAFARQGTVTAALSTVELLKAQVESLQDKVTDLTSENGKLSETVKFLKDQVSGTSAIAELLEWVRDREVERAKVQQDGAAALARIEHLLTGGLSNAKS